MKTQKIILTFVALMLIATSCKKTLDISIDESEKKLVVNSIINSDSLILVNVCKSLGSLEQDSAFKYINDAKIKLYENNNFIENLEFQKNGFYISTIRPEEGKTYKIELEHSILENTSSTTTILQAVSISQITSNFEYEITEYIDEFGTYIDTMIKGTINFHINDPINEENYYAISAYTIDTTYNWIEENGIYVETDSVISIWKNTIWIDPSTVNYQYSTQIEIGTDYYYAFYKELNDGKLFNYTFDIDFNSTQGKKIYFELFSIDENFYLYNKSLQEQNEAAYTPFAQPVNVYTNIINGYGLFGTYSIYTDSLTINI